MADFLFEGLELSKELQRAVKDMGFENATEIQAKTIPLILAGHDVIGRSQTGTGKTASFAIPAIEMVDGENKGHVQVLVVCPTRELAMQTWGEFKKLYKYKTGIKTAAIFGGQNMMLQIRELKKGINIVVGTPGRIMDHMRRGTLKLSHVKMIVLDEADEMLNMGFKEDIETILKETPAERQTILFCATMPREIMAITKQFQKNPQLVEVNREQATHTAIKQFYSAVPQIKKKDALLEIIKEENPKLAIVFCNTQVMVDGLSEFLNRHGIEAVGIHGSMKQHVRTRVMNSFKTGKATLLVATDVAARGIDVPNVEMVVNFDIPQNTEYYIHRIGRTGRAKKEGKAFTIISGRSQMLQLRDIERFTKVKIELHDLDIKEHIPLYPEKDIHYDVIKVVKKETPRKEFVKKDNEDKDSFKPKTDNVKIEVNIGREQKVAPNHIVGAIAERTNLRGKDIGKINILAKSSIVEIPEKKQFEVLNAMKGCKIMGLVVHAKLHTEENTAAVQKKKKNRKGKPNGKSMWEDRDS